MEIYQPGFLYNNEGGMVCITNNKSYICLFTYTSNTCSNNYVKGCISFKEKYFSCITLYE